MGETKSTGFGRIDLDFEDGVDEPPPPSFGALDWDLPEQSTPESAVRPIGNETAPLPSIHDDAMRMVEGNALSNIARSSAPRALDVAMSQPASAHSGHTTQLASPDEDLLAPASGADAARQSARSASASVPSESGVGACDDFSRMRELYARGDAEAALAVASAISEVVTSVMTLQESGGALDESTSGVADIQIDVSLSGLEPGATASAQASAPAWSRRFDGPPRSRRIEAPPVTGPSNSPAPPAAGLTLTQRQSIPRVAKAPQEIAVMPIDHRGGFLLGFVDGMQTLEEILDVCAMPSTEALDLIVTLAQLGVIEFD